MTTLLFIPEIFGISLEVFFILLVLGVPVYFVWRWILKKLIKPNLPRKITTWAITIISTPILYIGIVLLWLHYISYYPNHEFNKERWLADQEKRYELSADIIESHMLIGKTKSEVRQILGDEGNKDQSDNWTYYLGFRPGFANIDPDMLDIEFKNGKVIKVGQHET